MLGPVSLVHGHVSNKPTQKQPLAAKASDDLKCAIYSSDIDSYQGTSGVGADWADFAQ